jgi:hypothetical protein
MTIMNGSTNKKIELKAPDDIGTRGRSEPKTTTTAFQKQTFALVF